MSLFHLSFCALDLIAAARNENKSGSGSSIQDLHVILSFKLQAVNKKHPPHSEKMEPARAPGPINQMPSELLLDIIHLSTKFQTARLGRVQELTTISSRWKATIDHTPSLWSVINSWDPQHIVAKALRITSECPLDVEYSYQPLPGLNARHHYCSWRAPDFLATMLPHAMRWRSAKLELYYFRLIETLLRDIPTPILENVEIRIWGEGETGPLPSAGHLIEFFNDTTSRLKSVVFHGLHINWGSSLFRRLRCLGLGWITPTADEVLDILSHNPELIALTLEHFGEPMALPLVHRVVQLPLLTGLTLTRVSPDLLRYIDAPAITNLAFSFDLLEESNTSPLVREMLLFVANMKQLCTRTWSSGRLKVAAVNGRGSVSRMALHYETSTYHMSVELPYYTLHLVTEILVPALPNVELGLWIREAPHQSELHALHHLPKVTLLHLDRHFNSSHVEDGGSFLTRRVEVDGVPQWLFPGLRVLSLRVGRDNTSEQVAKLGRNRFSKADSSLEKLEVSVVAGTLENGVDLQEAFGDRVRIEKVDTATRLSWDLIRDW